MVLNSSGHCANGDEQGVPERNTLFDLFVDHKGKVSDKWELYLRKYEEILKSHRDRPVRILEIGVQNGGSLEMWAKYFPFAVKIIGVDIDPKCGNLLFSSRNIDVVVGDASAMDTMRKVLELSDKFDIIIDDGSHCSGDVVRAFYRYFSILDDRGIYVIEDMHCSYWHNYGGGINEPHSSISFLKRLMDVINWEHWGLSRERRDALSIFEDRYSVVFDDEGLLASIHSIEVVNSMAIIRKEPTAQNVLGKRLIAGEEASVAEGSVRSAGCSIVAPDQTENFKSGIHDGDELRHRYIGSSVDALESRLISLISLLEMNCKRDEEIIASITGIGEVIRRNIAIGEMESALAGASDKVASLETTIASLDSERQENERRISELEAVVADARAELLAYRTNSDAAAEIRFEEIARLTSMLLANEREHDQREKMLSEAESRAHWLHEVARTLIGDSWRGRLIGLLPAPLSGAMRRWQLKRRNLFDAKLYLDHNPDVLSSNIDPLRHYIVHGYREGRHRY